MSETKRAGITEITIENFKGIGAPVTIPLKPITLLFGANSAGKSTILKSLAYFRDVLKIWRHPDQLNLSGEKVAIGDFRSAVHGHDENRAISIAIDVQRPEPVLHGKEGKKKTRTWADIIETMFSGFKVETLRVEIIVSSDNLALAAIWLNDQLVLWVDGESIELKRDSEFVRKYFLEWGRRDEEDWFTTEELQNADLKFLLTLEEQIDFSRPWSSYIWEAELWSADDIGEARQAAKKAYELCAVVLGGLDRHLKSQRYIGPLRAIPEHHQRFGSIPADAWYSGLAAWRELQKILRGEAPYYRLSLDLSHAGFIDMTKQALEEIGRLKIGYTPVLKTIFSVEGLPETGNKSANERIRALLENGGVCSERQELVLRSESGIEVEPCAVGTGVSQALPIAVGAFAEGCRLMMVEQPELHLHPRLQCDLADVFVSNIHRHTDRKFLIETHSEHLILRLLRRIRETSQGNLEDKVLALTPDQVGVLYVEESKDGTRISELRIGPDGQFIDEWPGGFFEEDFNEIVGGL